MKNITPIRLALFIAGLCTAVISLMLILTNLISISRIILAIGIVFPVIFVISWQLLRYFFFRKIKLIYKLISSTKLSELEESGNELDTSFKEIDKAVANYINIKSNNNTQEELNNYKREYVGNIAHELKTPIFSIQGYLENLLDGALEDETLARNFINKALNNSDRLFDISKDLEQITKLEFEINQLNQDYFDITALTHQVFESLEIQAKHFNATLQIKEGCNTPHIIYGDKKMIWRVLSNLIGNALKYGKENGVILVGFYLLDEKLMIEISDDGDGIEKEHLERLFERFYRVEKSRTRDRGGSGLGLSIVKHIIEAHGQQVFVRSSIGIGSTFGFTLNLKK